MFYNKHIFILSNIDVSNIINMTSIKNSYLHKVFYLEDNGCRKYFLVTDYNKKTDIYEVIECYPDGEPMTSGYQGKVLASNIKKVPFVDISNPYKEEFRAQVNKAQTFEQEFIKEEPVKSISRPVEKKMEPSKEEDPTILAWRRMSLRY